MMSDPVKTIFTITTLTVPPVSAPPLPLRRQHYLSATSSGYAPVSDVDGTDGHASLSVPPGHHSDAPTVNGNRAYRLPYIEAEARARWKKLRRILKTTRRSVYAHIVY